MAAVMKVVALADGRTFDRDLWVETYDLDAVAPSPFSRLTKEGGAIIHGSFGGRIILTPRIEAARRFDTNGDALTAWNSVCVRQPLRPDGRLNKPLTALTIEVAPAPD